MRGGAARAAWRMALLLAATALAGCGDTRYSSSHPRAIHLDASGRQLPPGQGVRDGHVWIPEADPTGDVASGSIIIVRAGEPDGATCNFGVMTSGTP